jgi:hypothetical protein
MPQNLPCSFFGIRTRTARAYASVCVCVCVCVMIFSIDSLPLLSLQTEYCVFRISRSLKSFILATECNGERESHMN